MPSLRECSNGATLVAAVAQHVARRLKEDLAQGGQAVLVVSGGRSPVPLLQALSTQALTWERVVVTLTDERWVAPDQTDSNEALVRRHLLQGRAAIARFVPLWTGDDTPEAAVPAVCTSLGALAHPFSQVILGMGEDGHMASLFPGSSELGSGLTTEAAALAVHPPHAAHARLSLSLRALLDARDVVLMIAGEEKRLVLERALGEGRVEDLPVRAILRQTAVPVSVFWAP
ncbi:6-phosphogluconolactonase [Geothrix sp. PMB-07]|uniref:6-phosphogluconolactonase n=1 Tax=Geothrix sp. PMB-07 TaxID=3068640 RepID=UPI0027407161|nr:6-phosphogluconolactonase [Geothrix sp. PMB-07]WLT31688.1 6-phosphogluconolactonase [Geothrix sp. PMB-07]